MEAGTHIRELLAAARRGDPDAVGQLFEAARSQLLQLADRELPADVRAKIGPSDVVQETAVDVHRDFARFNGTTPEALFAWLRGILRNNVVDVVRLYREALKRNAALEISLTAASAREAGEILPALTRTPDGSAIRREEAAAINFVLARLPADYRRVLELRYWNGMSFVDMAPHLDRSPDAARKLWYRALECLQCELAGSGSTDAGNAADAQPPAPH